MLDFGSNMPNTPERDADDLFASLPAGESGSAGEGDAEKTDDSTEKVAVECSKVPEKVKKEEKTVKSVPETASLRSVPLFRGKRKADAEAEREKLATSQVLKSARERAGLTPEDVENETQIRVRYLLALEDGYFSELPQQVYVLAYLRKLCALYKISKAEEEELVHPWRKVPREVPENLPATVIPDENSENRKILHRVEVVLLAAIATVVIGLVAFLVILGVSFLNRHRVEEHFDMSSLLKLQEKPRLVVPVIAPVKE